MFLTGYHGTSLENANRIIQEKRFIISTGKKQWLANGIYFYCSFNDAYHWRNSEAMIHSVIKIEEDEYLDIDTSDGKRIYAEIMEIIADRQKKSTPKGEDAQENQCAVMKMIWDTMPQLKVIIASFPTEPTALKTLIDVRSRRKEFCVRDNECVKHMCLIRKGDLDD